ncbi:MAG: ABC transporter substrate-binding protein [Fusobacterium sp.]|nr:ABC transporter substrate-binding protein [Fusobacterium sp.]
MKKRILMLMLLLSSLVFAKVPQRAVSTAHFSTELLLAIGAENQMVGTAWLDNPVLPELKEKYDKVPVLSDKYPTKEKFYSVKPDFLTGWHSVAKPKNLGPKEELEKNGVQLYFMKSLNDERVEVLYEDILEFGKIFALEDNAKKVVDKIKEDLKEVEDKVKDVKKVKVFAYDSGTKAPFVIGGKGMGNYVIELAGGENITNDIPKGFGTSTWENVIMRNPEYIIIVDYGDTSFESKVMYLKNESPIKDLPAVRNNKFIRVSLASVSPGIRIGRAAKEIAEKLHGVKF